MLLNAFERFRLVQFFLLLSLILNGVSAWGQDSAGVASELALPSLDAIKRVSSKTRISAQENQSRTFILDTHKHLPLGEAYVIITDHREAGYKEPLHRLANHYDAFLIELDDIAQLPHDANLRESLRAKLIAAKPRYVAIAPRLTSYRENVLLSLWEILSTLDDDAQLDVFPGILLAPTEVAFSALIDRSINVSPQTLSNVRPFAIGQITDDRSIMGQRAGQKVGIVNAYFHQLGCKPSSLVTRTFQARVPVDISHEGQNQWTVSMPGPRRLINELPPPAKKALDESSLLVMFGHGVPGMTCSMDVKFFEDVTMTDKVVLCGSCFSAAPTSSDFPTMNRGQDGSEIRNDRERFLMRAIESGAVVFYGHMRENSGFPQMFPVLEAWMNGLTVGEGYQRLINAIIEMNRYSSGGFILADTDAKNQRAIMRRNALLYVVVGDPALVPFHEKSATE